MYPAWRSNTCPNFSGIQNIHYVNIRTLPHRSIPKADGKYLRVSFLYDPHKAISRLL